MTATAAVERVCLLEPTTTTTTKRETKIPTARVNHLTPLFDEPEGLESKVGSTDPYEIDRDFIG